MSAGKIISGASTITMQTVKIYTGRAKSWRKKLKQIAMAITLEKNYSKEKILENYINSIFWGSNYRGIEAASLAYFNKHTNNLNALQCLSLAALIKSPAHYHLKKHFDNNRERTKKFLLKHPAFVKKYLTKYIIGNKILWKKIWKKLKSSIHLNRITHSYFPYIQTFFRIKNGKFLPRKIYTSLDKNLQDKIQNIVNTYIREKGIKKNIHQASVIILDNLTHSWLVWVANASPEKNWINFPMRLRQPGSTLKPFLYALALENINNTFFTPADILNDFSPENYKALGNPPIRNYNDHYYGKVSFRLALGNSLNVASAELLKKIGVAVFLEHLKQGPIQSLHYSSKHYGLGLILGNGETSLYELTKAYNVFASGGLYYKDYTSVHSKDKLIKRLYSPQSAYLIYDILQDKKARIFSFGHSKLLDYPFPVALKTGTSEGFRDNWIIAFTKLFTIGIWAGNFNRSPMINSSGLSGAGPLLYKIVSLLHKDYSLNQIIINKPEGITDRKICKTSGKLTGKFCPDIQVEIFAENFSPKEICQIHTKNTAQKNTSAILSKSIIKYKSNSNDNTESLIVLKQQNAKKLKILKPQFKSIYKINYDIPAQYRKIVFKISIPENLKGEYLNWKLNGFKLYKGKAAFYEWSLKKGDYTLQILHKNKILSKRHFKVLE